MKQELKIKSNKLSAFSSAKPTVKKVELRNSTDKPKSNVLNNKSNEKERNKSILSNIVGSDNSVKNVEGVLIEDIEIGSGPAARIGSRVNVFYTGWLKSNNRKFDSSKGKPFPFRLGAGEVIRGWDIGVHGMKTGGTRKLTIPPEKAYGKRGSPPVIPPNSALIFEVKLLSC